MRDKICPISKQSLHAEEVTINRLSVFCFTIIAQSHFPIYGENRQNSRKIFMQFNTSPRKTGIFSASSRYKIKGTLLHTFFSEEQKTGYLTHGCGTPFLLNRLFSAAAGHALRGE